MGQKTNPLCFRLGTTQKHHSVWFEEPKRYPASLQEDYKIRHFVQNYVENELKKNVLSLQNPTGRKKNPKRLPDLGLEGIVRIEIKKRGIPIGTTLIQIIIYSTLLPDSLLEDMKRDVKKQEFYQNLEKNFQKPRFSCRNPKLIKRQISLRFITIEKPFLFLEPKLLAQYIALQIKNRVPCRSAMREAMSLARRGKNIRGIKIKIAGRINGRRRAFPPIINRKGKLPLHRIRSKINYCSYTIQTIYGVLGVKIWIYRI